MKLLIPISWFYSQSSWLTLLISWNVLAEIQMFHNNISASAIYIFPKEEH